MEADSSEHRSPAQVRQVYDEIADHFAETRHSPWPEVRSYLEGCESGSIGVDIGCANGRHLPLLAERCETVVGIDVSKELLQIAGDETGDGSEFVQGDAGRLPLIESAVDIALYVATIHHLPDRAARVRSLSELARVLAPGGRALVSAWSTEHDRFDTESDGEGFDTIVDWTLPGGETVPRFYHIYCPSEFRGDIQASGLTLVESYVSSGNCYAEVRG